MGDVATLRVAEIFGPTVQGEGPSTGQLCHFLRLSGCNLTCSWCDTPYTWDWTGRNGTIYSEAEESHDVPIDAVADQLSTARRIIVTGGEPLMQQPALVELLKLLDVPVEIETNGTIIPSEDLAALTVRFNVSPKLRHSGVVVKKRLKPAPLHHLNRLDSVFKFVCADDLDVAEVAAITQAAAIAADRVWVMPLGTTRIQTATNLHRVAETAIGYGFNVSTRLHVDLWNDQRGH